MFNVLIDTCVWLDLAKDRRQLPVLAVIDEMIRQKLLSLLVPRVVLDELRRNRERIANDSAKSLSAHFRVVRDAVDKVGGDKKKMQTVLSHLDDVNHKIPMVGGAVSMTLDRIEALLTAAPVIEPSEGAKLRAAERAIAKRAPFHRDKNAMADALLIETYADCVRSRKGPGARFAFVTHNKNDFSVVNGNQKVPHPDIAETFSRITSLYFISLPELLRRIEPSLVSDVMFEHTYEQESRSLAEILKAEDLLFHQVWYNRHWNLHAAIAEGRINLVEKETFPRPASGPSTIQRDVWEGAQKAARRVERKYGKKNLGPWDDFEWGMISGKLSALRWVLGDEWDMLDT